MTGSAPVVMSALIVRAIVDDLVIPPLSFRGTPIRMIWDPTVALMQRIATGERADGILAIDWAIDELAARNLIVPSSRRPFAKAAFGLAIAQGATPPDISTVQALRETLQAAPTVAYSRAGASGIYFERLIDHLGIGAEIRAKSIVIPAGLTGEKITSGEATLAVQQISELLAVPGIDLLGPFPAPVQETTDFSAAIFLDAVNPAGAQRFFDELFTTAVRNACLAGGLVPFFD
jgi:molybdate transport system substrate-binding protein